MEKNNKSKIKKLAIFAGISSILASTIFLIYKKEKLTWNDLIIRDYKITSFRSSIKPIFDKLNKTAPILEKLEYLRPQLDSDNWVNFYGASLVLFAEFEHFLETILNKHKKRIRNKMKEKLGTLRGEGIIFNEDYQNLTKLYELRNKIAHGDYAEISRKELINNFNIIHAFIQNNLSLISA